MSVLLALVATIALSRTDALSCLADNIYFEAAYEPRAGQIAVAEVTVNRARSTGYTLCDTVYFKAVNPATGKKEAAFSWTLGRAWRPHGPRDQSAYEQCLDIARGVMAGELSSLGDRVLYYHAVYVHPAWARRYKRVARIGQHIFYRSKP